MSNHEIEDVLSSIRRLVSEDLRPAPRSASGLRNPEPVGEKLILTPALRVVQPAEPIAEPTDDLSAGPEVEPVMDSLTESQAEWSAPDPLLATLSEVSAPADPAPPADDVVTRLGAAVAEEEWESPFGDPEVWSTQPTDVVPTFVHRARAASVDDLSSDYSAAPMATFADLDEASGATPEDFAPSDPAPVREPLRRVAPPADDATWADQAAAAAIADIAGETEEEIVSNLYDGPETGMVFDEEVLRELVRDLIREELSGTLGERITRNVRKLVRAEIARALALREFE